MGDNGIEWINPKSLKEHPFSAEVYGVDSHEDLIPSILEHGVLVPLVIQGDVVISGHRRLRAALAIGMESVPCIRRRYGSVTEEREAVLEHNRFRRKTGLQLLREGKALEEIERLKSKRRQVRGGEHKVRQNLAQPREKRKTRSRIARAIGLGSGEQWRKLDYVANHNPDLLGQIGPQGLTVNKAYTIAKQEAERESLLRAIPVDGAVGSAIMRFGAFEKLSREIPDNSVELILTNPGFKTSCADRWGHLASVASRVLVDGGFLIAYVSKFFIVDGLSAMTQHLNYFWMIAFTVPGSRRELGEPKNVVTSWMPILIFSKGEPNTLGIRGWRDFLLEKSQQKFSLRSCVPSARYLIRTFSSPGATVLDPFAHTGEFLVVALGEGRNAYGYEANPDHYNIAAQRLVGEGGSATLICPRPDCQGRLFREGDEMYCIRCGYRTGLVEASP